MRCALGVGSALYGSSCRQGLKVERNKLVPTACICIIIVVTDIIIAIQHDRIMHCFSVCNFISRAISLVQRGYDWALKEGVLE